MVPDNLVHYNLKIKLFKQERQSLCFLILGESLHVYAVIYWSIYLSNQTKGPEVMLGKYSINELCFLALNFKYYFY